MSLFDALLAFIDRMFEFFSFSKRTAVSNGLGVYVKSNTGETVYVELDPTWEIGSVKEFVSKKIGIDSSELKIIFAGKELQDNVTIRVSALYKSPSFFVPTFIILQECDLGQKSVLHAVKTRRRIPKHVLGSTDVIRERHDSLASDGFKSISESLLEHELETTTTGGGNSHLFQLQSSKTPLFRSCRHLVAQHKGPLLRLLLIV